MDTATPQVLMTQSDPPQDDALQRLLLRYGIRLSFCANDCDALFQQLRSDAFAAVVVRVTTPERVHSILPAQYELTRRHIPSRQLLFTARPPFIAVTASLDPTIRRLLLDMGYDAVISLPFSEYTLAKTILEQLHDRDRRYRDRQQKLLHYYRERLVDLSCPMHLRGFQYLSSCLLYLAAHPDALHQLTKVLYPQVARLECTSATNLERAMRTALEHIWENGDREKLAALLPAHFGPQAQAAGRAPRASISEFLAAVLEDSYSLALEG